MIVSIFLTIIRRSSSKDPDRGMTEVKEQPEKAQSGPSQTKSNEKCSQLTKDQQPAVKKCFQKRLNDMGIKNASWHMIWKHFLELLNGCHSLWIVNIDSMFFLCSKHSRIRLVWKKRSLIPSSWRRTQSGRKKKSWKLATLAALKWCTAAWRKGLQQSYLLVGKRPREKMFQVSRENT